MEVVVERPGMHAEVSASQKCMMQFCTLACLQILHATVYDLPRKHFLSMLRIPSIFRYRHEAFMLNNKLVVIGGGNGDIVCPLDKVEVFDFHTGHWSSQATFPDPQHGKLKMSLYNLLWFLRTKIFQVILNQDDVTV
jgi:hypothetical protein